jgi:hypothetical protein
LTGRQERAEIVQRFGLHPGSRFDPPGNGLRDIPRHTPAREIHATQFVLGIGMPCLGCLGKPATGLLPGTRHAGNVVVIKPAEPISGSGIPSLRKRQEYFPCGASFAGLDFFLRNAQRRRIWLIRPGKGQCGQHRHDDQKALYGAHDAPSAAGGHTSTATTAC